MAEEPVELHIEGNCVGSVVIKGADTSWGYGEFSPNDEFSRYATLFGRWSLLIHDDENEQLSQAALEELREAEYALDALDAKLHWPETGKWLKITQLNIDAGLIEWKVA